MKKRNKKKTLAHLIPVLVGDENESTTTVTMMGDDNSSSQHLDQDQEDHIPVIQLENIPPIQPEEVQAFLVDQGDTQPADVVVVPAAAGVAFATSSSAVSAFPDHHKKSTQDTIIPKASLVRDSSLQDVELGSDGHHQNQAATSWLSPREVPSSSPPPPPPQEGRPRGEYISVTIIPATTPRMGTSNSVGIRFFPNPGGVVSSILEGSPLDIIIPPLLQPADQIISINGKACSGQTLQEITTMMIQGGERNYLNMIFHNKKNAQPNLVEAMIVKRTPQDAFGLRLASSLPAEEYVQIDEIWSHGLIAQSSLLNVGDKILAVNGISCVGLSISTVIDILRGAPKHVHILARAGPHSAMVVAEVSPSSSKRRAAEALRYKEDYSKNNCRCCGCLIVLFVLAVLFLVIAAASSSRNRYDGYNDGSRDSWDGY